MRPFFGGGRGAWVPNQSTTTSAGVTALVPGLTSLTDHELVSRAKRGDNQAIEALMRRYNRRLFRMARSILRNHAAAEDAVQECYVRAFMNLHRYEPTGAFGAWLTRIAINEALMMKRRTRGTWLPLEDLGDAAIEGDEDLVMVTPDSVQATSARQLLELAVDSLPQEFRTVFMLRVIEQLSVAETAVSLGINEATVKTRLHRAKLRLRANISRRLQRERLTLFEFDGVACDRIVARVLTRLTGGREQPRTLL